MWHADASSASGSAMLEFHSTDGGCLWYALLSFVHAYNNNQPWVWSV